ncbi:MAG: T9SS type A sorting domain-containing protein [Chitinophagales bacterium]
MDSVGTLQWQNCFGGTNLDQSYSIVQSSDSGYLAVGYTISNDSDVTGNHGALDIWAVKLDTSGIMQWRKCYGGTGNDQAYSVTQCKDGGYIIAGRTQSNNGDVSGFHGAEDYWIIKIDAFGTLEWQQCYGGSNSERAYCISKTSDNGYIITGFTLSNDVDVSGNHGNQDVWTVKIDSTGTIQWQKCYGGSDTDEGNFISETSGGGYIVAGLTSSNDGDVTGNHGQDDYWILKLDVNGNIEWQKCLGGTLDDIAYCIRQTSDSGYVIGGVSLSNDGDVTGNHDTTGGASYLYDYWIVKLLPDTITSISNLQPPTPNFQIFPNPSSGIFQITFPNQKTNCTLEVLNTLGQIVFKSASNNPKSAIALDLSFLPKGIYVLKINDGTSILSSKLIIE